MVITWNDAQEFVKWAAKKTGRNVCLPTEAQWEYACRAGTATRFNTGDKDADLEQAAWFNKNSGLHTNACGQKKPNAWGLYDMHGNVWEWCEDYASEKYYADSPAVDPQGPATGVNRVLRGGSWNEGPGDCHAARRIWREPGSRDARIGFRVMAGCDISENTGRATLPEAPAPTPANLQKELSLNMGGGVKMELVLVKAGEFDMGADDVGDAEKPVHRVKISKPFYMGKYEVTVAQFRAFAEATKYQTEAEKAGNKGWTWDNGWKERTGVNWKTPNFPQEDNYPVCLISWNDAQEFCKWAAKKTGRSVCLPTEAQWEYACRAGTTTKFNTGDKDRELEQAAWFKKNSGMHTNACGQKKPNAWGLYDMHGNVWEWVQDYFSDKYYADSPPVDPKGPASGGDRVLRGGGWTNDPGDCRAARRNRNTPGYRSTEGGFRVVAGCDVAENPGRSALPEAPAPTPANLQKELSLDLGGGVKMEMVLVKAGEFDMGSNDGEGCEKPVHKVKISKPFYIGKYDVTVAQFRAFADATKFQTEAEKLNKGWTVKDGKWQEVSGVNWRTLASSRKTTIPSWS